MCPPNSNSNSGSCLLKTLICVLFLPQFCSASSSLRQHFPNILFLLADDLGFGDFDWRDWRLHTPNLRQLAFSPHSVQLLNTYVGPLCTPARSAMLSGLYPFRTGTQNVFMHSDSGGLPPGIRLLPQLLRERGYRTHLIGKWHLGYCRKQYLPTTRGFDTFYGYYGSQEGYYNHSTVLSDRTHPGVLLRGLDLFREGEGADSEPDWAQNGQYSTDLFTDEAIRVLSSHQRRGADSSPFFLMLAFQAVHAPLEAPPERFLNLCAPELPASRRIYCGMLAAMDAAIGRLIAHLRAIGEYERTVVVFGTDVSARGLNGLPNLAKLKANQISQTQNGGDPKFGASNAPLRGGKGTLWEGGTRSTAIVHSPAHIGQFAFRHDLFHAVDWPATLLGVAGIKIETYGDGVNQWPMIIGERDRRIRRSELIYALDSGTKGTALRDSQFKLLIQYGRRPSLFHLPTDPSERTNLANTKPKLVRRMNAKLAMVSEKGRMAKSVTLLRTDSRGWPEKHGGVFGGGWC